MFRPLLAALIIAPASLLAEIQPLDGVWSGQGELVGQSGCPAPIVTQMSGNLGNYTGEQLSFPSPFDPTALIGFDIAWTAIGESAWRGTTVQAQPTQMGEIKATTVIDLTVNSPSQMSQVSNVTIELPQAVAAMLNMNGTSCALRTLVTHQHGG